MRARFVNESIHIGDRKKQLSSSTVYEVTGVDNLSGRGDLFIKNQNTGIEERCYSRDWNDMRKYSYIIMEAELGFKRGQNPHKSLSLNGYKDLKINHEFIVLRDLLYNGTGWETGYDERDSPYIPLDKGTRVIIQELHPHKIHLFIPKINDHTVISPEAFHNHIYTWFNPIYTNESMNFKRGQDPHQSLGIGKYKEMQVNDAIQLNKSIYRREPGFPWSFDSQVAPDIGDGTLEQRFLNKGTILYYHNPDPEYKREDDVDLDPAHPTEWDSAFYGMNKDFLYAGLESGDFTFLPDYWNTKMKN